MTLDDLFAMCSPEPNTGCWLWTGPAGDYGTTRIDGRPTPIHRAAYRLAVGPIAPGMVIDHRCGEKLCANPSHLEQVTNSENVSRGQPQRGVGRGLHRALVSSVPLAPRRTGRLPETGTTREAAVLIRLTPEERDRLTEAAKRAGLGLGPWLRSLGMREASRNAP